MSANWNAAGQPHIGTVRTPVVTSSASADVVANVEGSNNAEFSAFEQLTAGLLQVPKDELDEKRLQA